ncbi:hypothetical protein BDZ91DRAFT_175748 [Kalaharituber pfeilii]|nr:hypothetical protein BDZ91DRAFT_175748 [Kalaharituber pfeilii]
MKVLCVLWCDAAVRAVGVRRNTPAPKQHGPVSESSGWAGCASARVLALEPPALPQQLYVNCSPTPTTRHLPPHP